MDKTLLRIKLYGAIIGPIWDGSECFKEFYEGFAPDHQPFSEQWTNLRDALLHITNGGDFQHAEICELGGNATYYLNGSILKVPMKFDATCKAYSDLLSDDCFIYSA